MVPGLRHEKLTTRDGTEIAYQLRGSGKPAVVLANGLGGSFEAFRHVYSALGDRYTILCWDYRGLYGSGPPRDRTAVGIEHQCEDIEQILDHLGIDRAVHIGWSMGVQVNFELFRRRPERIAGLVAINGTYGRPFRTALSSRYIHHVVPVLLRAARAQANLIGIATRAVVGWDGLIAMMQRFGMVSPTLDVDAFRDVAVGFKDIDWRIYTDTMARLGEHDASEVLERVKVPTLVITGDKDILTPPTTAERIHRSIPGSRLVVIRGGTHYTPVEYPAIIQEEITGFLGRVPGYAADAAAA